MKISEITKRDWAFLAGILAIWAIGLALCAWKGPDWNLIKTSADWEREIAITEGERDNALKLAAQYKAEYQAAVFEIADLKAENEVLTAAMDELRGANETAWTPAGEFRIYHYCPCTYCTGKSPGDEGYGVTATGTVATEGRTVAVDPDVIPLGSEVLINGQVYVAEDTGVTEKCIDLFVSDHAKAAAMGTYLTAISWRES